MTETRLHFGIIGFGFMGQTHAKMITEDLDYAEVVGVCDINKMQLEYADASYQTYVTADALLANDAIDTVIIAVPNHLHLEMVRKAAAAGKDIICEKPAALNATEFEEMMRVVEAAGVRFTIHHQRRWDKDYQIAKTVYESGTLGQTYTIQNSLYGFNGNMHDWHVYPEFGGGMLYDWGIHLLDQMLFMVDSEVETVYATVKNVINTDVDDYFNIQLQFKNGVTGQVELGTYFLSTEDGWFERHWFLGGNQGSAKIDGFHPEGEITRTTDLLRNVPGQITMTAAGPTRSFGPAPAGRIVTEELPVVTTEHRDYFDAYDDYVTGKGELVVKPVQILRLMKLMDAIRVSAKEHRSVNFE